LSAFSQAFGQLRLISGAPTPNDVRKFAISLVRLGDDGSIVSTVEILPREVGAEWIGLSYDRGEAVILSGDENTGIVLDLKTAAVAKRCPMPLIEGGFLLSQFMADVPGRGLTFEWLISGTSAGNPRVMGMVVDPDVTCDASFVSVAHTDVHLVAAHGTAGVADISSREGVAAVVQRDGTLIPAVFADDLTPWLERIPLRFVMGLEKPMTPTSVLVNNSDTMVLHVFTGKDSKPLFLALRKRDKSWHSIPVDTDLSDHVRGFGRFIAVTEARVKTEADDPKISTINMETLSRLEVEHKVSAGTRDWRTTLQPRSSTLARESARGPDIFESFFNAGFVYPGRLWLFDVETENLFKIETKQGDSEVLLVDNQTVYYRVTNRIYSARILSDAIGMPKLVVQDDIVEDVHYAFVKK
jgi:hypothetical protein